MTSKLIGHLPAFGVSGQTTSPAPKSVYNFSFKMAVGLGAPPNRELSAIAINGGTMIKVAKVDRPRPPNTTTPMPRYSSDPAPGKITSGTRPKSEVKVDMKIGLIRVYLE